jgi:hypothetical protein
VRHVRRQAPIIAGPDLEDAVPSRTEIPPEVRTAFGLGFVETVLIVAPIWFMFRPRASAYSS